MTTTTQGASAELWTPVTKAGQVSVDDKLRFTIGDKAYSERAKLILHAGTDKEEVIYDKGRNYYFITAMVLSGFSNHKNVEVLPRALAAQPVAAQVEAAPQAEQVAKAEPRTHMSDEQAEKWAWEQVKKDVGTDGWTVGDSCNYFGFFLWGWRYRAQYERQRATPERAAAPADLLTAVLNCYSPDDTISDYQDKIRGVFATARAAEGDGSDIFALMDVEDGQMVRIEVVGDRVPSGRYELRRADQQASAQKGGA